MELVVKMTHCYCGICGICKSPNPWPGSGGLAGSLIPVADSMRELYTDFGLRPYRVFSVVYKWSGGSIGRGQRTLILETEMTPTPRLAEWNYMTNDPRSGGMTERNTVRLTQISARYTETQIDGMFFRNPLPQDCEGFIEILNAHDGPKAERRRFAVKAPPFYLADRFEWRCDLIRQDQDTDATVVRNAGPSWR